MCTHICIHREREREREQFASNKHTHNKGTHKT